MASDPDSRATDPSRSAFSIVILLAVAIAIGWLLASESESAEGDEQGCPVGAECVTIHTSTGDYLFTVEWAIEPAERSCGLMFREEMAEDHGMIFDFQVERSVSFWMRNTLISLDMVFIRDGGEVLNIAEYTTPLSLAGVPSDGPVRYVLEVVGGTAERIDLEPGDLIDIARAPGMTEGTAICYPAI